MTKKTMTVKITQGKAFSSSDGLYFGYVLLVDGVQIPNGGMPPSWRSKLSATRKAYQSARFWCDRDTVFIAPKKARSA